MFLTSCSVKTESESDIWDPQPNVDGDWNPNESWHEKGGQVILFLLCVVVLNYIVLVNKKSQDVASESDDGQSPDIPEPEQFVKHFIEQVAVVLEQLSQFNKLKENNSSEEFTAILWSCFLVHEYVDEENPLKHKSEET